MRDDPPGGAERGPVHVSKVIGHHVPFAELLGLQVTHRGHGVARLEVELRPDLHNSWASAHGGVVMTVADVALAVAAMTLDPRARGAVTIDLTVSFIGPGKGRLVAEGRCLRAGNKVSFCEGEIHDASGALVAKAVGTFMVRHERSAPSDAVPDGGG